MKKIKRISKNGNNSFCIILPKSILTELNLNADKFVSVECKNGGIFIKEVKIDG
jgi:antitoxin component of MazEF toxin-antitoxin module